MLQTDQTPKILEKLAHASCMRLSMDEALPPGVCLPASLLQASPKRQREFHAGRSCAARALRLAGLVDACAELIEINEDRSPRWPAGFVGSITHTDGLVCAAVASTQRLRGLGIDSEKTMSPETLSEVGTQILLPSEWQLFLQGLDRRLSREEFATLVFSSKESIYKCFRPLVGRYIDFKEAEIFFIDLDLGSFRFRFINALATGFVAGFEEKGWFEFSGGLVHTAVALSAEGGDFPLRLSQKEPR